MTQKAQVISVSSDGTARVQIERMSACGHDCSTCEGCGLMAAPIEAIAQNTINAKVGDTVLLESGTKQVIGLAFFTYLLPILLLFMFFAAARLCTLNETYSSLFGVLGFFLGLLGAVLSNRRGQVETSIVSVISKGDTKCSDT